MTLAALLLTLASATPPPAAGAALGARAVRPDGMEVLALPVEGARTASLRYVVRAGSADDPPGKEGLAHLLEHAVLQARGPDGLDLPEAARAAGARLNAFTSRDATVYVLDAPVEVFPALAERLVRAVADPALERVDLSRELDVIAREDEYHEGSVVARLVEDTLFRATLPEGPVLGSARSRDRIRRGDLIDFYQRRYLTTATTVVAAGAVTPEDLGALLDRAVRVPPALPGEQLARLPASPMLPVDDRIRAPFLAVVLGYRLDEADRESCAPLAALLERRLTLELVVGGAAATPALRTVEAQCLELRGIPFVLSLGYTRMLDAPDLGQSIQRVFDGAVRQPASAAEREALELRRARLHDRAVRDPAALADEVAREAARERPGGTPLPEREPRPFPAEAVRRAAGRAFAEDRRVLVLVSPFEG